MVHAEHSGKRVPFGPEGPAIGCASSPGRAASTFAGDTDLFPGMAALAGTLDVALLPVWGWGPTIGEGHMDPGRAAEAAAVLGPRLAIPIHWGTFYPAGLRRVVPEAVRRDPAACSRTSSRGGRPDIPVRILAPGESVEVPPLDDARDPAGAGGVRGGAGSESGGSDERGVGHDPERGEDEDEEQHQGGEDADGVNLEVRGLRGHRRRRPPCRLAAQMCVWEDELLVVVGPGDPVLDDGQDPASHATAPPDAGHGRPPADALPPGGSTVW